MNKKRIKMALLIVAVVVIVAIIAIVFLGGKDEESEQTTIGFIISGGIDEDGWNKNNYLGIKSACDELGANLLVMQYVHENTGECVQAVNELIRQGAKVIILTSYNYADEVKDIILDNPDVAFYCNSSSFKADNLSVYFARMYQARYLSGVIAGKMTKTNNIGYVAAMEVTEVVRGIDAFTLGVKSVNPNARVFVSWTGSWEDYNKEIGAVEALCNEENVDIITYHQNQSFVSQKCEELGVYYIGYNSYLEEENEKQLTALLFNWEAVYKEIVLSSLRGSTNEKAMEWIGLDKDAVVLYDYSGAVSPDIINLVETEKERIIFGQDVFSGLIYDSEGNIRCDEGESIGDEILFNDIDWLVEGVYIYGK